MEFSIINISPDSDFKTTNESDTGYRDSIFGTICITIGGHSEIIEYIFFLELKYQLEKILIGKSNVANYYDVDDFGCSYREENNPYIKFFIRDNGMNVKYRWDERIYSCSLQEFKKACEEYINRLQTLLMSYIR